MKAELRFVICMFIFLKGKSLDTPRVNSLEKVGNGQCLSRSQNETAPSLFFFFAAQNIRIRHRRATFLPPKKISFRRWTVVEMWLDCSFAFKCAKWIFTIFSLFRLTKAPCWLLHVVFLVVRRRLAVSKLLSMNRAANRREKEGNKFILFFLNKIIRINFVKVCSRWSVDFRCLHIFLLKEKQVKLDPAARNGWNWITVKLSDFQAIFLEIFKWDAN